MGSANYHSPETTEKQEPDQLVTTVDAKSVEVCLSGTKVGHFKLK